MGEEVLQFNCDHLSQWISIYVQCHQILTIPIPQLSLSRKEIFERVILGMILVDKKKEVFLIKGLSATNFHLKDFIFQKGKSKKKEFLTNFQG